MTDKGLNIEDQGHPAEHVGVNIKNFHDGTYEFTQCALINSIIDELDIGNSYTKPVPAKVALPLHALKILRNSMENSITAQSYAS